jgi:anti-anti-sigma factor
VSEQLARTLREATDEDVEQLLFVELEELLRYPAPPQITVLAGALQCDLACLLGIVDGDPDLLPRALATTPESHISRFQSLILGMPRVTTGLRDAINQHLIDTIATLSPAAIPPDSALKIAIDWSTGDDVAVVALAGDIDRCAIPALRSATQSASVRGCRTIVVDLREVAVLAPSALAALVALQAEAGERGQRFIVAARGVIRRMIAATGHDAIFEVHDTVADVFPTTISER